MGSLPKYDAVEYLNLKLLYNRDIYNQKRVLKKRVYYQCAKYKCRATLIVDHEKREIRSRIQHHEHNNFIKSNTLRWSRNNAWCWIPSNFKGAIERTKRVYVKKIKRFTGIRILGIKLDAGPSIFIRYLKGQLPVAVEDDVTGIHLKDTHMIFQNLNTYERFWVKSTFKPSTFNPCIKKYLKRVKDPKKDLFENKFSPYYQQLCFLTWIEDETFNDVMRELKQPGTNTDKIARDYVERQSVSTPIVPICTSRKLWKILRKQTSSDSGFA